MKTPVIFVSLLAVAGTAATTKSAIASLRIQDIYRPDGSGGSNRIYHTDWINTSSIDLPDINPGQTVSIQAFVNKDGFPTKTDVVVGDVEWSLVDESGAPVSRERVAGAF